MNRSFIAIALLLSGIAPGLAVSTTHWQGELNFRGSEMPLRLEIDQDAPRAWLDLPGLVMAWEPIPVAPVEQGLSLEFPFGIGSFTIDTAAPQISAQRQLGEETMRLELRPAAPPPFRRQPLLFTSGDIELAGELVLPAGAGPHPAIVLLHGSATSGMDNWAYRSWADWLVRQGFAVLYYDKRGHGGSGGESQANLDVLAADGVAAVRALRVQEGIDPARIGIKGGSQGAWLALQVAAELGDVAFLVLSSVAAVPPWRQELQAVEFGMRGDGIPAAQIEDALSYLGLYFYVVRSGAGWPELQAAAQRAHDQPWGQYVDQPRSEDGLAWWRANHDFQPGQFAAQLDLPVLALYGGADWITPPLANAARLPELFAQPGQVRVEVFPGADHRLELPMGKDAQGQWQWPRMAAGLFPVLENWLQQQRAAPARFAVLESAYLALRDLRDAIDVTQARGAQQTPAGSSLDALRSHYGEQREGLVARLAAVDHASLGGEDARALAVMQAALSGSLDALATAPEVPAAEASTCDYDASALPQSELQQRMYGCFAQAAATIQHRGETLDRLSVFARLSITADAAEREALWRALAPVWRAVNADNQPSSPYRTLVRLNAQRLRSQGAMLGESVRGIGVEPGEMADWLLAVLEAWRQQQPAGGAQPWDHAYATGAASRALEAAVPVTRLRALNDDFYANLGADPALLNVQYDLAPRAGKDPVAYTTFGRRPRLAGNDPGEPWVFAAYRSGGLGNLAELLHETGHAAHIAAIRVRPAFADWPDSDIFTEGVADLAALELWTPAWQQRYLGQAADAGDSARERLAPVMLDIAWSLFEWRMHERPGADPNKVWTELTSQYLGILPQPGLSWWAVRGQLIDAPGYMLNYAAGAVLVADLRAHLVAQGVATADWYRTVSEALFRFGLERDSASVVRDFLGRPPSPQALLDEIRALSRPATRVATAVHHQP